MHPLRFDDAGEPGIAAPHKPRPKSKLEELMERDRLRKATDSAVNASVNAPADTLHWVVKGLVVKVLSKALKEAGYYKVKAVVKRVLPPSKGRVIAELEVLTDGALLQVDEAELETVLPQPGTVLRWDPIQFNFFREFLPFFFVGGLLKSSLLGVSLQAVCSISPSKPYFSSCHMCRG